MTNVVALKSTMQHATRANDFRAIALATAIAQSTDESALTILATLAKTHSERFMQRVYSALDVLA